MLSTIYNAILYRPIFNVLVFLYNIVPGHDFGIAIILLTILILAVLYPLSYKLIKSRQALTVIQPKIKEIQNKYKNKEEQAREMMKAYKEHNINPVSGCLPLLIQLPILIALYRVLLNVLKPGSLSVLYPFIENPGTINSLFFGVLNLAKASPILAGLAGLSQFLYSKLMMKYSPPTPQPSQQKGAMDIQKMIGKQTTYIFPFMIVIFGLSVPAGLTLYWIAFSLLSMGRDYYLFKKLYGKNKKDS
ncbi:MAG: hypothetical protein COU82_00835 [Candidatus Portnoybacteria bacterium CG10_big_fil_rev_8_21_14_0_10_38_18]|uniref:Membrane insertase YidC/Oxa/ALB C-terminal domain-containing protein n=1 Tax=Candidatus Portnoybacteria bacterium CG10_big_fil_rev_8_21_14_0_10_38_18 TaxID=1974813 RepID=A0A2M8KCJ1_9BACT|nr:MAG: hypothetical protein COU82_00835 [Candidatus Portnoybacteria bacterium CG10_big_fil_rev_8_21_14_0_10_38_18]